MNNVYNTKQAARLSGLPVPTLWQLIAYQEKISPPSVTYGKYKLYDDAGLAKLINEVHAYKAAKAEKRNK